ncbi:MAG: SigE family RNA polymerase sigma factor [Actinomycetota bacterium]
MKDEAESDSADESYRSLFAQHHRSLFRFAVLLVGDRHVADELTAEVFARVLPKWRAGGVNDPLAYLRRALVNEVRSRHRRRTYEQRALDRVRASTATKDEQMSDEMDVALLSALRLLPMRQRAVVVLRFHDDLSEAEVARTLGMAVGTVKSQTSRGLAVLRELLEGHT